MRSAAADDPTPSASADEPPPPLELQGRSPRIAIAILLALCAASIVPRLPILASAAHDWSADEAVDALVVQHLARGAMAAWRDHGEVRLEGKEYVVHDGDIINFRFAT